MDQRETPNQYKETLTHSEVAKTATEMQTDHEITQNDNKCMTTFLKKVRKMRCKTKLVVDM